MFRDGFPSNYELAASPVSTSHGPSASDRARDTFWYVIPGCLMMSAGFLAVALSSNPGIAVMNMIGILGAFVGPYWMGIAKDLTGDYRRGLLTMAAPMLVGAGIMFYLRWRSLREASPLIEPAMTNA
jgi:uncharacterized membrane protein YeaQ/YmgE (transglycosylase-associated protein family)